MLLHHISKGKKRIGERIVAKRIEGSTRARARAPSCHKDECFLFHGPNLELPGSPRRNRSLVGEDDVTSPSARLRFLLAFGKLLPGASLAFISRWRHFPTLGPRMESVSSRDGNDSTHVGGFFWH